MSTAIPSDLDAAIHRLRAMVGERELDSNFTGQQLTEVLERAGSMEDAAAEVWSTKAAIYAELVNTSEGGSRRDLGQLHQNALRMVAHYRALSVEIDEGLTAGRTQISKIVRG